MNESLLLSNHILLRQKPRFIIINIEVNGKPKLINFICPNYKNEVAYENINILSIAWICGNVQKQFLIKNDKIQNSPIFETTNEISDESRHEKGLTFTEMAVFLNEVLDNVEFIVMYGSDFIFNLLVLEYKRNLLSTKPLQDKTIINLKQGLWKQKYDEKLDEMVNSHGSTIEKIQRLLKIRCG